MNKRELKKKWQELRSLRRGWQWYFDGGADRRVREYESRIEQLRGYIERIERTRPLAQAKIEEIDQEIEQVEEEMEKGKEKGKEKGTSSTTSIDALRARVLPGLDVEGFREYSRAVREGKEREWLQDRG